jgi:hypothetical protein
MFYSDSHRDRLPSTIPPQPETCLVEIPSVFSFLFQPARYKLAYGGRDAAKGRPFADALLILVAQSPLRGRCSRELQSPIADSVEMILNDQIARVGPSEVYLLPQKNTITSQSGFLQSIKVPSKRFFSNSICPACFLPLNFGLIFAGLPLTFLEGMIGNENP